MCFTYTFIFEVILAPDAVTAFMPDNTFRLLPIGTFFFTAAPVIFGFFVSTTLNLIVFVFLFPNESFTMYLTLYVPSFFVLTFPNTFIFPFLFVTVFPALSLIVTRLSALTFDPYSTVLDLAFTVGAFFLYGFFGSGSVGSQSVNFPLVIGVNPGLFNGSSFFFPQKILIFVPTAQ